ncbi:MAG: tetratricopeptide repeat protein [Planctomycetota bacterium]|jgi:predicted Zn-dependent protease
MRPALRPSRSLLSRLLLTPVLVGAACLAGCGDGAGDSHEAPGPRADVESPSVPALADLLGGGVSRDPQIEAAVRDLLQALETRPADPEAWATLAEGLEANGLEAGARLALDGWVTHAPDDPRAHFLSARRWWSAGAVERALEALSRSLELDPQRSLTHALRGDWLLALGRFEEAIAAFDEAGRAASGDVTAGYAALRSELGLRRALLEAERFEEAVRARSEAWSDSGDATLGPFRAYDGFLLGRALQGVGDARGAQILAQVGVPQPPRFDPWIDALDERRVGVAARMDAALEQIRAGQAEQVIAELEELSAADPDDVTLQGLLVAALNTAGRSERALELLESAVAARPEHYRIHMNLALTLSQLGRRDDALRSAERAIDLHPDYRPARQLLNSLQRL